MLIWLRIYPDFYQGFIFFDRADANVNKKWAIALNWHLDADPDRSGSEFYIVPDRSGTESEFYIVLRTTEK